MTNRPLPGIGPSLNHRTRCAFQPTPSSDTVFSDYHRDSSTPGTNNMRTSNDLFPSARVVIHGSLALILVLVLVACSSPSLRKNTARSVPSFANAPATEGPLAEIAKHIYQANGPEYSGFKLLDRSFDGLAWRLALIDSATSSLDIQTYLWYPDNAGRLILEHAVDAANRGVRVRLIVDDLLTIGLGQLMYELENHKNIEMRLFNPWKERSRQDSSRGHNDLPWMRRMTT